MDAIRSFGLDERAVRIFLSIGEWPLSSLLRPAERPLAERNVAMSITKNVLAILGFFVLAAVAVPVGAGATLGERQFPEPGWGDIDPAPLTGSVNGSCDDGTVVGAIEYANSTDTFALDGHEVDFGVGLLPIFSTWYGRDSCEFPRIHGWLTVEDIGPTCVRGKVQTFNSSGVSVGSRFSESLCQDLSYGNDQIYVSVVGFGDPDGAAETAEISTQIQDGNGNWVYVQSVTDFAGN